MTPTPTPHRAASSHRQGWWHWLIHWARTPKHAPHWQPAPVGSPAAPAVCQPTLAATPATKSPVKPLRVVRVLDADQHPGHTGRMLISGRMADVCAELDRLAAGELTARC